MFDMLLIFGSGALVAICAVDAFRFYMDGRIWRAIFLSVLVLWVTYSTTRLMHNISDTLTKAEQLVERLEDLPMNETP